MTIKSPELETPDFDFFISHLHCQIIVFFVSHVKNQDFVVTSVKMTVNEMIMFHFFSPNVTRQDLHEYDRKLLSTTWFLPSYVFLDQNIWLQENFKI